jgi:hypothetical protein
LLEIVSRRCICTTIPLAPVYSPRIKGDLLCRYPLLRDPPTEHTGINEIIGSAENSLMERMDQ